MQVSRARRLSSPSTVYHGAVGRVRVQEHLVLRARVVDPAGARLDVHRAQLPALERVLRALLEAPLLLGVADREPVLAELDAVAHQHPLELGRGVQELPVLLVGAEAHHALDAGAVVPGAVEEHDLAGRRQVLDVALEVPLRALALGRRAERDDPREARVQRLHDALDRAALAGRVTAFEEAHDPFAGLARPGLQLDELQVQLREPLLVLRARQLLAHGERYREGRERQAQRGDRDKLRRAQQPRLRRVTSAASTARDPRSARPRPAARHARHRPRAGSPSGRPRRPAVAGGDEHQRGVDRVGLRARPPACRPWPRASRRRSSHQTECGARQDDRLLEQRGERHGAGAGARTRPRPTGWLWSSTANSSPAGATSGSG